MKRAVPALAFAAPFALVLVACAATKPEPKSSSASQDVDPQVLEEHKKSFLSECLTSTEMSDFCDCSWNVATKTLTSAEIVADKLDKPTMTKLQEAMSRECKDKVPESAIRVGFINGCTRGDRNAAAYCECIWPELRKTLSVAQLSTPQTATSPEFLAAKKGAAKLCSPKLPEDWARRRFFDGCAEKPGYDAFCGCAWKELRTRMSIGEIEFAGSANSPEFEEAKGAVKTKCSKLLPK